MTTKHLSGTYPAGYSLSAKYTGLVIDPTASVGGTGVSAAFTTTIQNLGLVNASGGAYAGIDLGAGGRVDNGSTANTAAYISGYNGVSASSTATVANYGTIRGTGSNRGGLDLSAGISLPAGGSVTNGTATNTTATIEGDNGVYVKGSAAVTNFGTILCNPLAHGFGVDLNSNQGSVTNGSVTDTTAFISGYYGGVHASTVYNFGTIAATGSQSTGFGRLGVYAFDTLTNGSVNDTTALIEGASSKTIINFGTISAPGTSRFGAGASYYLMNGSVNDTTALIDGVVADSPTLNFGTIQNGVLLVGSTLTNFGTISGSSSGVAIAFGGGATLEIEPGSVLIGALSGFSQAGINTIDLVNVTAKSATWADNALTVSNWGTIAMSGNLQQLTFDFSTDGKGGTDIRLGPSEQDLASISGAAYTNADDLFGTSVDTSTPNELKFVNFDSGASINFLNENNYFADYYVDATTKQLVVAFRGTNKFNITNWFADASFVTGAPTVEFLADLQAAATFLTEIETNKLYAGYNITLTGHSLGGAIAQLLGQETRLPTVGFDAPGAGALFTNDKVQNILKELKYIPQPDSGLNLNISLSGDQVSDVGVRMPTGMDITIPSNLPLFDANNLDEVVAGALFSHDIGRIISQLSLGEFYPNKVSQAPGHPYADAVPQILSGAGSASSLSGWLGSAATASVDLQVATDGIPYVIFALASATLSPSQQGETIGDGGSPSNVVLSSPATSANKYSLVGKSGSPNMASATLPNLPGVAEYEVSAFTDGVWSPASAEAPAATFQFAAGTTGFQFSAIDAKGHAVPLPSADNFFIQVSFAGKGAFTGSLTETLGSVNWITGSGDWGNGSNWSGGASPGTGNDVTINAPGTYTVTISGPAEETLINVSRFGATVLDKGALTLDSTLNVSAGKFELANGGIINGGTVDAAGGSFVWAGGTLDAVTYEGTLKLTAKGASVLVQNGLTATSSTGSGRGTILLTGYGSELSFVGAQAIDNATIDIGSANATAPATIFNADPLNHGAILTFGPKLVIQQSGAFAAISGSSAVPGDLVVNSGVIRVGTSGGHFTISPLNFTNSGTITVSNGDALLLQAGNLTNTGLIDQIGAGSITFQNAVTNSGTILAAGIGGVTVVGTLSSTGTLAGAGTLTLSGDGKAMFNAGTRLTLANITQTGAATAVTFNAASLTYGGRWTQGAGTLSAAINDRVNFTGAGDSFSGTLAGAGTIAFLGGSDSLSGTTISTKSVVIKGANVTLSGTVGLSGNMVAAGVLTIAAAGATLNGGGSLVLSNLATNKVAGASGSAKLTNTDRISGAGNLGGGSMVLVNGAGGLIDGDNSVALTIDTGVSIVTNSGIIEATGAGGLTIKSAIANTGLLAVTTGTLTADGAVTGSGMVRIAGGTADFASTFSQNVAFTKTTGTLELAKSQTYTGQVTGFAKTGGTAFDLLDIAFISGATKASYSGTTTSGVLTVTDATHTAKITLKGDYLSSTFKVSSDGHGGTTVVDPSKAIGPSVHGFIAAAARFGLVDPGGIALGSENWQAAHTLAGPRPEIA